MRRLVLVLTLLIGCLVSTSHAEAATGQLLRNDTGLYPRAVRLQHSGAANGRMLASVVTFVGADGIGRASCRERVSKQV